MYDWPLYIQKTRMACQPRHVITIKLFSAPSPSFYITVLKVIEEKKHLFLSERPSDSEVVA